MAFDKIVPEWNAVGTEPPSSLKNSGFSAGYKPPAAYFNWFWNGTSECLKELQEKALSGNVPVSNGGTGATTVAGARNALGLGNTSGAVPVANGGTGATSASGARENLRVVPSDVVNITGEDLVSVLNTCKSGFYYGKSVHGGPYTSPQYAYYLIMTNKTTDAGYYDSYSGIIIAIEEQLSSAFIGFSTGTERAWERISWRQITLGNF